jgi:DNA-binding response OmpR family regulator
MSRVLVVDDEEKIAKLVGSYLEASGYEPVLAFDGPGALKAFAARVPDCVILDINIPGKDGLEVAREMRASSSVPIIFLSARAEELDRILGLELGADDYVPKPFSPRELVSRVKAVLRRSAPARTSAEAAGPAPGRVIASGDLALDPARRSLTRSGQEVRLTAIQFDILAFLMKSPGRVYSRLEILREAAGVEYEGYERTLDAHIKNIRKALDDDSDTPRYLGTVRGVGYKFIEPGR